MVDRHKMCQGIHLAGIIPYISSGQMSTYRCSPPLQAHQIHQFVELTTHLIQASLMRHHASSLTKTKTTLQGHHGTSI